VLLKPHFEGTLAINNGAESILIAPHGPVDILLAGTVTSSVQLAVSSVLNLDFNKQMLPSVLASRGVDDKAALPGYPYRDDALLLWQAIGSWVRSYLAVYYNNDQDVKNDYELQALLAELISPEGGGLRGIGQDGGVSTFDYLVDMATMVIFTASVQHAAVNFPQNYIMAFTPAMPLAAYAPAPMAKSGIRDGEMLSHLPPLQQGAIQLLGLYTLGGVYYSRLGDYDRNIRGSYFTDPRVSAPLNAFQQQLFEVEKTIGQRNQERIPYVTLLPSSIPQSINI
jgi:arachidonate 15-lipoxygenase